MRLHTRHLAFAVALAAAPYAADSRPSVVAAQIDPVVSVATELCRQADRAGDVIVVAGPRLTSTSTAPRGEHEAIATALLNTVATKPQLTITMRSPWLVIHDAGAGAFSRFRCAADRAEPSGRRPQGERPVRIDVSRVGDVAWTTASHQAFLARSSAWREPLAISVAQSRAEIEVFAGGPGTSHVLWSGSQLIGVGPSHVSVLVADDRPQARETRIERPLPVAVFGYGGLVYVARGRCWDLYGGADLSPAVLQGSCDIPEILARGYLAVGPEQVRIIAPAGAPTVMPRPSIVVAHMSGNMRDVTKGVARLLADVYKPPPGQSAGTRGVADPHWRNWLRVDAWPSTRSFEENMRAIANADLGTLRVDGEWWTGKGASVSWAPAWNYVKVRGRSLAQLGAELTSDKRFTDDQVRGIVYNNAELRRSLEGELIYWGWLPIGALLDGPPLVAAPELALREETTGARSRHPVRRPQAFDTLAALGKDAERSSLLRDEPFLQMLRACRTGDAAPAEPRLSAIIRAGVPVFSGLEGMLAHALGEPSSAKFTAAATRVLSCAPPDGQSTAGGQLGVGQPMRLLVSSGARVSAEKFGNRAFLKQIIVADSRRYHAGSDWKWPVVIDGDVVIAVQPSGKPRAGWADSALRAWLDRAIRTHPVVEKLQVPVANLRIALPAAEVNRDAIGDSGIQILTLETSPAAARGQVRVLPCPTPPTVAERRREAETQIGLGAIATERRALLRTVVLVAEPGLKAFAATFDRPELGSIWQVPTRTGLMPLKEEPDGRIRTDQELEHGTFVAALLGATTPIKGLLSGTELGWVDLQKSPSDLFEGMQVIRGLGAVMNLSQALDARWWEDFRTSVAQSTDWHDHVLVVAAAQNVGEQTGDGEPLKTGHKNVVGVGLADGNGDTPAGVIYEMSRVDLLAPGAAIPSITHKGEVACGAGTSLAVTYVSAVAALLAERQDAVNAPLLRARLIATANWRPDYKGMVKGGLLNAARALNNIADDMLEMIVDDQAGTTQQYQTVLDHRTGRFSVEGVRATSGIGQAERRTHEGEWFKVLRLTRTGAHAGRPAYRLIYIDDNGQLNIVEDAVLREPNKPLKFNACVNLTAAGAACGTLNAGKIKDFVARYRPGLAIKSFGGSQ